ncbi:MAG: hypothetical protein ACI4F0_00785, partial [Agathobacter sp.]
YKREWVLIQICKFIREHFPKMGFCNKKAPEQRLLSWGENTYFRGTTHIENQILNFLLLFHFPARNVRSRTDLLLRYL